MAKYLNGWRRMAIVFVGTWLIVAAAILTIELMRQKPIFFTYRMLPAGAVFEKGKV
jgi:hypothetical protein